MARSSRNRSGGNRGSKGGDRDRLAGGRDKGPGGWPSKTGNPSGGGRNNSPPKKCK